MASQVAILPLEPLSTGENSLLLFMREEEKLARDVYIYMYHKWGSQVFANIKTSEQTHMDAMLMLINKYSLTDPVGNNGEGVFSNAALQTLYNQLIQQGSVSLAAALQVGATIEDKDIYDLLGGLALTDNQDITLVLNNLNKGSRNHMRAFYTNLTNAGATYTPQYITQVQFDAIISSGMERGPYSQNRNGNGRGMNGCTGNGPGNGNCTGTGPHSRRGGGGNCLYL
ncbi:MAG: DUF2202 domain-containing protein [Bacteroidetes bacterium]|nr:DUF2202 domain-containing protein [Bacteroidota bacterium]